MFPESMSTVDVLLGAMNQDHASELLKLAYELRAHGLQVDLSAKKIKPGKFRKVADERACAYAVWFEPDQTSTVSVWHRESNSTKTVEISSLVSEMT